jgi:hypothetical protein
MDLRNAAVAVKACEQINASFYSEGRITALMVSAGKPAPELGALPLFDAEVVKLSSKRSA